MRHPKKLRHPNNQDCRSKHLHFYGHFLQMPDILHILLNGTVRCELSAVGRVKDGCLSPPRLVPVSLIHPLVRLGIGTEVLEDKVGISPVAALGI